MLADRLVVLSTSPATVTADMAVGLDAAARRDRAAVAATPRRLLAEAGA